MAIELRNISKTFGAFAALAEVGIRVETGEFLALLGPSGSGKTTLLRIIAGLELPDSGSLEIDGTDVLGHDARRRRIGFVFQHYALFRHMTIAENIAFGLRVRPRDLRPSRAEITRRVHELLSLVQLEGYATRMPSQLSGGQRQRVALARALAIEPSVLLLDEPFGALDAKVRSELRRWLRRLHEAMNITSVFVTHDQEEALELADRVVVMNRGRVEQIGSPTNVYDQPTTPFVYEFLGRVNRFDCVVTGGVARFAGIRLPTSGLCDGPAAVYVRPHDVWLGPAGAPGLAMARIDSVSPLGARARIELTMHGQALEVDVSRTRLADLGLGTGDHCSVTFATARVFRSAEDGSSQAGAVVPGYVSQAGFQADPSEV
jgi:sulfate transport system ATP-binding protein